MKEQIRIFLSNFVILVFLFVLFEFISFFVLTVNFKELIEKYNLVQISSYDDVYDSFIKNNFRELPPHTAIIFRK